MSDNFRILTGNLIRDIEPIYQAHVNDNEHDKATRALAIKEIFKQLDEQGDFLLINETDLRRIAFRAEDSALDQSALGEEMVAAMKVFRTLGDKHIMARFEQLGVADQIEEFKSCLIF